MDRYDPISGEDLYIAALERITMLEKENAKQKQIIIGLLSEPITPNEEVLRKNAQLTGERDALMAEVEELKRRF